MGSHLKPKKDHNPDYPVKKYNNFCKDLIFIEDEEIKSESKICSKIFR